MRFLSFLFRTLIFILVLVFALANTHPVVLTLLPGVDGLRFEAPMVLWILAIFILGVGAAFLFTLPALIRGWRREKSNGN